jgi:hypothetical protein
MASVVYAATAFAERLYVHAMDRLSRHDDQLLVHAGLLWSWV